MRFTKEIQIHPGLDERSAGKGFSCAELLFILKDTERAGAVTFAVRTNWLPLNMERGALRPNSSLWAIDLTFHFSAPTLTLDQDKRSGCPYLPAGNDCHAVNETKAAAELVDILQSAGSDGVWRWMEHRYMEESRINNTWRKEL